MAMKSRMALLGGVLLAGACAKALETEDEDSTTGPTTTTSSTGGASVNATTASTTSATQGAGGSVDVGAGAGGDSGTGGSMNNCAHDVCTVGMALTLGCGDPCVDAVCLEDSYCCDTEWDQTCVDEVSDYCSQSCSGTVMPGDLVITEIMNNPSAVADTVGEWFEIHNVSQSPIDLQGMSIAHQANMPTAVEAITQSVVVPPGGFVVLGVNGDTTVNGNVSLDYVYSASVSLNNTTDYLAIQDASAVIIDELTYSESSGLDPSGKSRNLDPAFMTALDNDSDMHFCEATTTIVGGMDQGTPGAPNDICPP